MTRLGACVERHLPPGSRRRASWPTPVGQVALATRARWAVAPTKQVEVPAVALEAAPRPA